MAYAALVERTIAVPRKKIYQRLVDEFGAVDKLLPGIKVTKVDGKGIGSVRTFEVQNVSGNVQERLEAAFDGRLMSYSIVNEISLPFERYHAVVELADAPNGGTTVRWGSNWRAKGAPADEVKGLIEGLYNGILDGIVKAG